jgi:hypothetical protein
MAVLALRVDPADGSMQNAISVVWEVKLEELETGAVLDITKRLWFEVAVYLPAKMIHPGSVETTQTLLLGSLLHYYAVVTVELLPDNLRNLSWCEGHILDAGFIRCEGNLLLPIHEIGHWACQLTDFRDASVLECPLDNHTQL